MVYYRLDDFSHVTAQKHIILKIRAGITISFTLFFLAASDKPVILGKFNIMQLPDKVTRLYLFLIQSSFVWVLKLDASSLYLYINPYKIFLLYFIFSELYLQRTNRHNLLAIVNVQYIVELIFIIW